MWERLIAEKGEKAVELLRKLHEEVALYLPSHACIVWCSCVLHVGHRAECAMHIGK